MQEKKHKPKKPLKLARSRAELIRTVVVVIALTCQILLVLKAYGIT